MLKHTKRPVNFTYPSEEAMWYAANPPPDTKDMDNSRQEAFSLIKGKFEKEFTEFKDFLNGKLGISFYTYCFWFYRKLFYIESPEFFEDEVKDITTHYGDDISFADYAWIKNTRELIAKYHGIFTELYSKEVEPIFEEKRKARKRFDDLLSKHKYR